jgi:hypothetical protein
VGSPEVAGDRRERVMCGAGAESEPAPDDGTSQGVGMRTITAHRMTGDGEEHLRIGVVLEGVAALLALVAFIGVMCGLITWAVVHFITVFLS